ncbi:actin-related protein 8-like isoform X2 [Lotus japonicus]|uniref:actin-related protein 8-like isoform X2 n=1 Tax=Lotus japonicus TaxID=34305 RepID=UPI00258B4CC8|nr:actin-related protein 8-like isoform X2 [Lotus japonicus]
MAMLLRKLFDSASLKQRTTSTSHRHAPSPLGLFDALPHDILVQILRLLAPNDAAKLSLASKAWRSVVVSDQALWARFLQTHQHQPFDSIVFAETILASGYPLPSLVNQVPPLERVFSQRAQFPGVVIIDGGSGYCKFGWSKDARPSGRAATFLEFGNVEMPLYSRLRHFFATIYSRMEVKPSSQPVVVSLPICHYDDTASAKASRQQLKEAIYSALFDMNVPAVCALNQATLALYAANQTSGIAVNIGFQVTSVVPILNGMVRREVGVEVVGLGALNLTGYLREKMQQSNMHFESLYTVRLLKEKLCYVSLDYEAELLKDTQASFEGVEGLFTLSKERFQTAEILFQPRLAGLRGMSLHQAIALCMDHCYSAELAGNNDWFKTIVLSGGTACLPGLAERLEKELHSFLSPHMSNGIRVIPPPYGADTAWFGAKIIGSLSTFPGPWCTTKKQFRRKSKINRV